MADTWFVGQRGERTGPFELRQMRQMAADGRLAPTDLVWREGMTGWVPAASVADLFATRSPVADADANPYAAPMPDREIRSPGIDEWAGLVPAGTYSFSAAMALAFETFKAQWTTLLLLGLVVLGISIGSAVPQWFVQAVGEISSDQAVKNVANVVAWVLGAAVNLFALGPFYAGMVVAAANATLRRGQVGDMFLGFKRYRTVLLTYLLMTAISWGVVIVACIPVLAALFIAMPAGFKQEPDAGIVLVGGVATLIVMILVSALVLVRVWFAPALAADPALGALGVFDAVRLNWSCTSPGRGFSLIGLAIVVSLMMTLSVCLICVGYVLLGLPFGLATLGAAYQLLFRSRET